MERTGAGLGLVLLGIVMHQKGDVCATFIGVLVHCRNHFLPRVAGLAKAREMIVTGD
jgi:hypothetical protein